MGNQLCKGCVYVYIYDRSCLWMNLVRLLFSYSLSFFNSHLLMLFLCIICRRKSRSKRRPMGFIHNQASPSHTGIRTVDVEKVCNFSTDSDLCISIVTWNMNGQVHIPNIFVCLRKIFSENLCKKTIDNQLNSLSREKFSVDMISSLLETLMTLFFVHVSSFAVNRLRLKIQQKWLVAIVSLIFLLLACKRLLHVNEKKLQLCFQLLWMKVIRKKIYLIATLFEFMLLCFVLILRLKIKMHKLQTLSNLSTYLCCHQPYCNYIHSYFMLGAT